MDIEVYQWYDYIDGLHAYECMNAYENGYGFMGRRHKESGSMY